MRRFFLLAHDPSSSLVSVADFEIGDFNDRSLLQGEGLQGPLPQDLKLYLGKRGEPVDYLNNPLGWRLFSAEFRSCLSPFLQPGDSFEPLDVLDAETNEVRGRFWLGSFGTRVECLDRKRSIFRERSPGELSGISKLLIHGSQVPNDVHLFVLKEWPGYLLVDLATAEEIGKARLVGVALLEVEVSQ